MASGGVGRNIAENLARLGCHVYLMTALGNDLYGQKILEDCKSCGIDMSLTKVYSDYKTSVYMEMLDHKGELSLAISDMKIMSKLTIQDLESSKQFLNRAKIIVIDGNVTEAIVEYMALHYGHKLYVDTVSKSKAVKIKPYLSNIYSITPNLIEAQFLLDHEEEAESLLRRFIELGIEKPIITLGSKGVQYYDGEMKMFETKASEVVSVTGAGDAFVSGVIYGHINDYSMDEQIEFGLEMASATLKTTKAVHENIKEIVKK
jgi:pseudouridine kinase